MRRHTIPISELGAWARLNGIDCNGLTVKLDIKSSNGSTKGTGLVAVRNFDSTSEPRDLISVPRDLILSREQVLQYAAIDKKLQAVLDAAGPLGQSSRGAVLIFLLFQISNASFEAESPKSVPNPHSDYIKLLPDSVFLPTCFVDEERQLFDGTSLQPALKQKLQSLEEEFALLQKHTSDVPWCQENWWREEDGMGPQVISNDWVYVDALYRSRTLDVPRLGPAMIPYMDMVNHASQNQAQTRYEVGEDGRVALQLLPNTSLSIGEEVTMTYGENKGTAEMVFSYGFLEPSMTTAKVILLDLDIPDDDPLRPVKKRVCKAAPNVRLLVTSQGEYEWESQAIWWSCVNEEDGLEFQLIQQTDGQRQLDVLWKGNLLDHSDLSTLLMDDPQRDVYLLRATVILQTRVDQQLKELEAAASASSSGKHSQAPVRSQVRDLAQRLKELESAFLQAFHKHLEDQKTQLLESAVVKEYLNLAQAEGSSNDSARDDLDEEDFS